MGHRGTTSIAEALEMFMLDCEARRLTPATRYFYQNKIGLFVRWCGEHDIELLTDLTPHDLRRYFINLQHRELSSQYQNNIGRAIRAFLNYCVRDELMQATPFAKVKLPRMEKKILEALTTTDIKAILKSCQSERDRAICLFLLDTGVRASELLALNVEDIDKAVGTIHVRLGKGQKGRVTYIGAASRKQLHRYWLKRTNLSPKSPAFHSTMTGDRLTLDGLVQMMERLRRRSGVAICTCHTFRRTFAITCLRNGMNIYVLARLMGHADITILRQYLPLVESDLQDAHARFGTVDNFLR
ncbi:MAG: tyrosine-type recombinase/integrase [Caldilineaceae bacterium]|nr:tyrosine-type recombinase/integrase [Caldilineaceae bacterium]